MEWNLDELVERYSQKVYNLAFRFTGSREDSEDIVQDTFLEVYRSLPGFRGDSSIYTWIYRIAFNCCIRLQKSKPTNPAKSLEKDIAGYEHEIPEEVTEWFENPEKSALMLELLSEIRNLCTHFLLYRLPDNQRMVYIMRNLLHLSYKDISDIMGISENVIKARLARARQTLITLAEEKNKTCRWLHQQDTTCCKSRIGLSLALDTDLLQRVNRQAYEAGLISGEELVSPAGPAIDQLFQRFPELEYRVADLPKKIRQTAG